VRREEGYGEKWGRMGKKEEKGVGKVGKNKVEEREEKGRSRCQIHKLLLLTMLGVVAAPKGNQRMVIYDGRK
jgi:hypothetical protein